MQPSLSSMFFSWLQPQSTGLPSHPWPSLDQMIVHLLSLLYQPHADYTRSPSACLQHEGPGRGSQTRCTDWMNVAFPWF